MTAQILASELAILIQESKRKNTDIRSAAEKSLSELKALPNTSEAQLAAGETTPDLGRDLKRRPNFVRPFLLSCATRNPRYAGTAIACLQRLVVTNGLAKETLKDVLDVLRECSSLGLDIQLKILQALPSLLQNYASQLTGDLLATALHICFLLLGSKTAVVSNTAAATLQQLVVTILGKVVREDELASGVDFVAEVPIEDGTTPVRSAALDAYQLLNDLCLLTEGSKPQFLHSTSVSPDFGLELIESMISNHAETVRSHPEQIQILRIRLMPFVIRILSEKVAFSTTVRVMRLLPIILGNMLSVLATECEMVLGLLNHMLDPDAAVIWKRILCMEVFRGIHAEPALVRNIYAQFDEQEGKRDIIRNQMAIMVRLAAEKPSIIGLGQQSTIPAMSTQAEDESDEQVALQAEGVAGTIGAAMTLRSSAAPGISTHGSNMRIPCIEQLDKSEPPSVPPAYLYSLVLTCMNSFSEGLARFLLPFSIPIEVRSKKKQRLMKEDEQQETETTEKDEPTVVARKPRLTRSQSISGSKIPVNPMSLESHVLYSQIRTSASMVDSCWPALLAAYSTFFHAALDSEYYHSLVRSFQKFSQVAGLLGLSTPRDAFLTTLGKNAVPPSVVTAFAIPSSSSHMSERRDAWRRENGVQGSDSKLGSSPGIAVEKARQSIDMGSASLNTRNLLCLRALVNLGIALGPILQSAWSIILETLQQADLVITHISLQRRGAHNGQTTPTAGSDNAFLGDIGNEISAVNIAATRMFESCRDLPDDAFLDVLRSLKGLLRDLHSNRDGEVARDSVSSQRPSAHRRRISTAGAISGLDQDVRLNEFVIENMSKLIDYNTSRLLEKRPEENGWEIIVEALIDVLSTQQFDTDLRLRAASTLSTLINLSAIPDILEDVRDQVRWQGLAALSRQIDSLHSNDSSDSKAAKVCEQDLHNLALETLHGVLEQYGDVLNLGWDYVFSIVSSVFEQPTESGEGGEKQDPKEFLPVVVLTKSPKLIRSAFGSLQLIGSEFLNSVPTECLSKLLLTIYCFCCQQDDFNISLTSTTLFLNVSVHLWNDKETLDLQDCNETFDIMPQNRSLAKTGGNTTKYAVIWLQLLLLLVDSTTDRRLEVRHSALHTIFGILDSSAEKLRPEDLITCQRLVVLRLLARNETAYQICKVSNSSDRLKEISNWNETAGIMLNDISGLFGQYLRVLVTHVRFQPVWETFGQYLQSFLKRRSLSLSAAVYTSIGRILSAEGEKADISSCTTLSWDIWRKGNPVHHTDPLATKQGDNQTALLAYVRCFARIYVLMDDAIDAKKISSILEQFLICTTLSTPTPYSGDVDNMSPLQLEVVSSLRMIRTNAIGTAAALISSMASFVTLAYRRDDTQLEQKGPTFVALSKAIMDLLGECIGNHLDDVSIFTGSSLSEALRSLTMPVRLKYTWHVDGKNPPPWKKATATIVNILKGVIPKLDQLRSQDSDVSPIWRDMIDSCDAIISASPPAIAVPTDINIDQEFDIAAFHELKDLLIPVLGSTFVTDKLRRTFSESLFKNSIIHEPHPDDLPHPDHELLECLRSTHIGRTQDLPPSPRYRMAYVLVDELFDLVAEHDGSQERVKLAQAAAPYLILRVCLVLKAYLLDQPLRGRIPQPTSQKVEMLYILRRLVELDCEPRAIPDAPGVVSEHKKHLYRIYGLVTKALRVARRNEEMRNALTRVIETVSLDFGV
ncbi:hypothetical protein MMC18_000363 [Xylographa bjoerkii]|nr:hypothetical protein [Xylographa bjoerkii]